MSSMGPRFGVRGALIILTLSAWCLPAAKAAEYSTPRQLGVFDVYQLNPDGATGDEATTEPKIDLNNGLNGDNPYFQRTNVARAHVGGCSGRYWYTSSYQEPGEPDPAGPQYVDYAPPFGAGANQLTPGRYRLNAEYRNTTSRATYPAEYVIHHEAGTTTVLKSQLDGVSGSCPNFDLGEFDLGAGSHVRVNDIGSSSITFNRMRFTYLGPAGGVPYVDAGPDQTIVLPAAANLDGTAFDSDEGPNPLVVTWSKTSGPGTVTFGDANSADTTAAFSVEGTYILRLTANDGLNAPFDEVTITALPAGSCQLAVSPGCGADRQPAGTTYFRTYCRQYGAMTLAPATFILANQGASQITYSVQTVTSATNLTPVTIPWLSLDNTGGSIEGSGNVAVTASFIIGQMPMPANEDSIGTNTAFLAFSEGACGLPTITRKINVTVLGANLTSVHEYLGDVDPLAADSAGPIGSGYNFVIQEGVTQGNVEDDPDAINGKAWRILDAANAKTKYRAARLAPLPDPVIYTRTGATIVARMRVRNYVYTDPWGFGLLISWDSHLGADLFWGGPDGLLMETNRSPRPQATLAGDDEYHTFRMTAIGDSECNRIFRVYVDEEQSPVAVLTIPNASRLDTSPIDGLGFGAGNTTGSIDVAYDWVTITNAGAFAPGEEMLVLGKSLILGRNCGDPWVDIDRDGDVDQVDFAGLQACFTGGTGLGGLLDPLACACFDFDSDQDVDEQDNSVFDRCSSGPGVPADPCCDGGPGCF